MSDPDKSATPDEPLSFRQQFKNNLAKRREGKAKDKASEELDDNKDEIELDDPLESMDEKIARIVEAMFPRRILYLALGVFILFFFLLFVVLTVQGRLASEGVHRVAKHLLILDKIAEENGFDDDACAFSDAQRRDPSRHLACAIENIRPPSPPPIPPPPTAIPWDWQAEGKLLCDWSSLVVDGNVRIYSGCKLFDGRIQIEGNLVCPVDDNGQVEKYCAITASPLHPPSNN